MNEKPRKLLLDLVCVSGHSGDNQFEVLCPILQEFNILNKVGAIIGDNSSTNDTLCQNLQVFLNWEANSDWNAKENRIRCIGHILNLIAQAFLFKKDDPESIDSELQPLDKENLDSQLDQASRTSSFRKLGILGKLHNIVVHIRSSPARTKQFRTNEAKLIPLDNSTRWNSWYSMLSVALETKSTVIQYTIEHHNDLESDELTSNDWLYLQQMMEVLKTFYSATLLGQGDNAYLSRTIVILDALKMHLVEVNENKKLPTEIRGRSKTALRVLTKYRNRILSESSYYLAAIALHPSYRINYFKKNWDAADHKLSNWETRLSTLWSLYKARYQKSSTQQHILPFKRPQQDDHLAGLLEKLNPSEDEIADEWALFQASRTIKIECSPLSWWLQPEQQKNWPYLTSMAVDILSIPAMSDEPERVFSGGRRTVSWERMRLGEQTIQAAECLKSWFREDFL